MPDPQTSTAATAAEDRQGQQTTARTPALEEAWDKANRFALRERFVYRGSAVGLAGRFSHPQEILVPAQASVCLPSGGGLAEASVEGFKEGRLLAVHRVSSRTEGVQSMADDGEKRFKTTAEVTLEGLNIAGRFSADRLQVSLVSHHRQRAKHPRIVPVMPAVQSFQLDGQEIRVHFETELFSRIGTWGELRQAYSDDPEFFRQNGHLFFDHKALRYRDGFLGRLKRNSCKKRRKLPSSRGYLLCTIVRRIESDHPDARVFGNIVELAGFGRFFLGEMIIDRDTRRLALLRFELDPDIGVEQDADPDQLQASFLVSTNGGTKGGGEGGCVGTNGHCYP